MTANCISRAGPAGYSIISLLALLAPLQALADDRSPNATADGEWTVTVAPYLWATGLDGSVGVLGLPAQSVDLDFTDVLESLEGGLMGVVEARRGRFSLGFDLLYANVSDSFNTPVGVAATSLTAEVTTITATAVAGYDLVPDPTFDLDLVGGARYWSVDNELRVSGGALGGATVSDGDTWIDLIAGAKFRKSLNDHWDLAGWALVGVAGASDSMWDVMAGVSYRTGTKARIFAGYRVLSVEYEDAGFVYDVTQKGPIIGGVFHF